MEHEAVVALWRQSIIIACKNLEHKDRSLMKCVVDEAARRGFQSEHGSDLKIKSLGSMQEAWALLVDEGTLKISADYRPRVVLIKR